MLDEIDCRAYGHGPEDRLQKVRHARPDHGTGGSERDQERAQMMQHIVLRAMHEKHVLRVIIDMRLKDAIGQQDAEKE